MASGDFSIGSTVWPGISKLIEEAGEVGQVCGKLMGSGGDVEHWDGTNLKQRLEEEMGDLYAAIKFVEIRCGLDRRAISTRSITKFALFEKWHRGEALATPEQGEK